MGITLSFRVVQQLEITGTCFIAYLFLQWRTQGGIGLDLNISLQYGCRDLFKNFIKFFKRDISSHLREFKVHGLKTVFWGCALYY